MVHNAIVFAWLQAAEELAASQTRWQQQITALQQTKAAAEAALTAAHGHALAAQAQALKAELEQKLTAAEAAHRQQVQLLEQQLAAARALASTTEDSAAQQTAQLQQQLAQEQQAVLDFRHQLQLLNKQLEQAAVAQQELEATQVWLWCQGPLSHLARGLFIICPLRSRPHGPTA